MEFRIADGSVHLLMRKAGKAGEARETQRIFCLMGPLYFMNEMCGDR